MKSMSKNLSRFSLLLTFCGAVGFALPAHAELSKLFGVTLIADVSGDAQKMTARSAQRLMRGVKEDLGEIWGRVDLSLVAFGNGLETRVDRLGKVKVGELQELLEGYDPEASAPDEPGLRALRATVRKLQTYPAGQMIIVLAGGDLRDAGPDDSSLENPKIELPENTYVMLIKTTPEAGRDLRKLGEGLENKAENVTIIRFGSDERAQKRVVKQITEAFEANFRDAIRSGTLPGFPEPPADATSDE